MLTVTVTIQAWTTFDVAAAMREIARLIDEEGEIAAHDESPDFSYDFSVQGVEPLSDE